MAVFEDVPGDLRRVEDADYDVYVLSNGSPVVLDILVDAAELEGVLEDIITADEVKTYKPNPKICRHAGARRGTPIDRILHVSGGALRDVWGAKHEGMQACWLSRPEKTYPREHLDDDPDLVVESFHELADGLS